MGANIHIVISVAPSPQGELFATGSGDKAARIWRLVLLKLLHWLIMALGEIKMTLRFHRYGQWLQ